MRNFILGILVTVACMVIYSMALPVNKTSQVVDYELTGFVTTSTDEGWHEINFLNESIQDIDLVKDRCIFVELDTVYPIGTKFYVITSDQLLKHQLLCKQAGE